MIGCILSLIIFAALTYGFFKLDANPLLAFYERFFPNKHRLRNKTVWIVGASTGIGEAIAHKFAELNCRLILTSTSADKLEKVKAECLKRSQNLKGDDILVLPYDISIFKENDGAFKKILDKFGNIDVLVNNAARMALTKIHTDTDFFELHRRLMDINYFSNIYIGVLLTRHWLATKTQGIICATSSVGSYTDMPFLSAYTTTKKAMNNFYRDLAVQTYKDGIRICLSMPGPVESNIAENSIGGPENQIQLDRQDKMTAERCAELTVVGIANRLAEFWPCANPWLLFTYISMYFGFELHWLTKQFGLIRFFEERFVKKMN